MFYAFQVRRDLSLCGELGGCGAGGGRGDPRRRAGDGGRAVDAGRRVDRGKPRAEARVAELERASAAVRATAALFRIAPDRHQREAKTLLGEDFAGVACSDRWWAYDYLDPGQRQLCWAHLARDFTAHSEGLAAQQEFGQAGLEIAGRLFEAWEQYTGVIFSIPPSVKPSFFSP